MCVMRFWAGLNVNADGPLLLFDLDPQPKSTELPCHDVG